MEQLYVKQSVTSSSLSLHPYNCVCGAGRFLPVAQMFCDEGPSSTTMNVPLINIESLAPKLSAIKISARLVSPFQNICDPNIAFMGLRHSRRAGTFFRETFLQRILYLL